MDLQLGPDGGEDIPDGGASTPTTPAPPWSSTRCSTSSTRRRGAASRTWWRGRRRRSRAAERELRRGVRYLNPALSTGARLFGELSRDDLLLRRFLVDSSELVTALAQRRRDLRGAVSGLGATFTALGSQQDALADSVDRLPPFLRRANSTFVDLRAALDDVDPLVDAAKPVARRLGPFLSQARVFAGDAEPTIRDLSRTIRAPAAPTT